MDQAQHEGGSLDTGSSDDLDGTTINQDSTDVWMSSVVTNYRQPCHIATADHVHDTIKKHYQLDQQSSDAFGFLVTGGKVQGKAKQSLVKIEVDSYTAPEKAGHMIAWYYSSSDDKVYVIDGQAQGQEKVSDNISPWLKASEFDQNVFFMRLDDKLVRVGQDPSHARFEESAVESSKRPCSR
mgnify:CR=1 FL=1